MTKTVIYSSSYHYHYIDAIIINIFYKRNKFRIPVVHGFVKTSRKQLYLRDIDQQPYIVTPLSFIDYYFVDGNKEKAVQLIDLIIKVSVYQAQIKKRQSYFKFSIVVTMKAVVVQ